MKEKPTQFTSMAQERRYHAHSKALQVGADWQTKARGTNTQEYACYIECANDGKGRDITNGKPLKSFDEWVAS
jgi:hypothetical protein